MSTLIDDHNLMKKSFKCRIVQLAAKSYKYKTSKDDKKSDCKTSSEHFR